MRALGLACLLAGCTFIVGDPDSRDNNGGGGAPDLSVVPCANVQTDPHNCGACGHDCGQLPGVDPTRVGCTVGVCDLRNACLPGRADCSGGYIDGCETDITTANHCGSCTAVCGGTTPLCAREGGGDFQCAGGCSSSTPTQCGTSCVDTLNNPQHCGGCTTVCPGGVNTVGVCQNGSCSMSCSAGFHSCSGMCVSSSSTQSCGTLCTPCPAAPANGVEVCDVFAGCDFHCNNGFTKSLGMCMPNSSSTDMATLLPPCDCSGLNPDPLGNGGNNPCPITSLCVGKDCCEENSLGFGTPMCTADPGCASSSTAP